MDRKRERASFKRTCGVVAALVLSLAGTTLRASAQNAEKQERGDSPVVIVEGKFYCNTKALSPAERARHEQLSKKLLTKRKETMETENGYEFQFSPSDVSVGEVAEWVVGESKCCPFFDFHIDLEKKGKLICLRLTGSEGIKEFIRSEFALG